MLGFVCVWRFGKDARELWELTPVVQGPCEGALCGTTGSAVLQHMLVGAVPVRVTQPTN